MPNPLRSLVLFLLLSASVGAAKDEIPAELLHDVDHPWNFEPRFSDRQQWEARAKQLREQILVSQGLWPMPEKTPLNPSVHGSIQRDGYTIEKVFFASIPGHYVSGNLYRPTTTGKHPAVLSPHGHWSGGRFYQAEESEVRKQMESGAEKTIEGARFPIQARCAMLARMGCVVFQYDMIGYADSQAIEHRTGFVDAESILRLQSFMGLQTWNSIRALDFLATLPDVDPARIAVTGASGGATQTLLLCAIDGRPGVAFPAVMVSEAMQGGCICENAPLLRVNTNNAEIAALFAPKPLAMTSADDWTHDLLTRGYPQIWSIYKLYDSQPNVAAWYRSFPHNYNQVSRELMYNWVNKHLKLGLPEPVIEKPFVPVPPKELSVYDIDHPRPGDSLSASALRESMTAASTRQLAELRKDAKAYAAVAATALRAMIGEGAAGSGQVVELSSATPRVEKQVLIENGKIRAAGDDHECGFCLITPVAGATKVVVWPHFNAHDCPLTADGTPRETAKRMLDAGSALLVIRLWGDGLIDAAGHVTINAKYGDLSYPGYHFGYNRSLLATQIDEITTAVGFARQRQPKLAIGLLGQPKVAVAAALAWAADDGIGDASIDLDGFDFDRVTRADDPLVLPGAVKYGGIDGLLAGRTTGRIVLFSPPKSLSERLPLVVTRSSHADASTLADALLKDK